MRFEWPSRLALSVLFVLQGCSSEEQGAVSGAADAEGLASPNESYALLVGIGRYPSQAHWLPGPTYDVAAMRALLIDNFGFPQENVLVITDELATRDAIVDGFRNHLSRTGDNGTALFFFAGHGTHLDGNYSVQDPETSGRDQALLVWDNGEATTILLDDELGYLTRELDLTRQLLIVDACFSGTIHQVFATMASWSIVRAQESSAEFFPMRVDFAELSAEFAIPAQFITDGGASVVPQAGGDLADMGGTVLLAATRDQDEAYSVAGWPLPHLSRSVFSHHLEQRLASALPTELIQDAMADIRLAISNDPICLVSRACQEPQIVGEAAAPTVGEYFGNPR